MFTMSMKSNIESATRDLRATRQQIPLATAKALTFTAERVVFAEVQEMKRVLDRPTPFTLNALRKTSATPAKLEARVWTKDLGDYRKRYGEIEHYLWPQIVGGPRALLGVEKYLQQAGILPAGMFIVPGKRAELDAYGNFKRGQWNKILSALGAAEHTAGYSANRTQQSIRRRGKAVGRKRKGRLVDYFAGRPKPGWPMGIWQKVGMKSRRAGGGVDNQRLRPILIFVRAPRYSRRFDFPGVAKRVSELEFDKILQRELFRTTSALRLAA